MASYSDCFKTLLISFTKIIYVKLESDEKKVIQLWKMYMYKSKNNQEA